MEKRERSHRKEREGGRKRESETEKQRVKPKKFHVDGENIYFRRWQTNKKIK